MRAASPARALQIGSPGLSQVCNHCNQSCNPWGARSCSNGYQPPPAPAVGGRSAITRQECDNMGETLMTPAEAVGYLRLDQQGLRQPRESLRWLCRSGKLKFTKIGRYIRFKQEWLDELVNRNAVQRGPRTGVRSAS